MKKIISFVFVAVLMAASAHAISMKGIAKDATSKAVDTAKNKALESEINNELKKFDCKFKDASTHTDLTCDFNQVIDVISKRKGPLEALDLATVYTHIKVVGTKDNRYQRENHLEDVANIKLSWANVDAMSIEGKDNDVDVWVEVK